MDRKFTESKGENVTKQEIESINMKFESSVKLENEGELINNEMNEEVVKAMLNDDINEEKTESLRKMVENIIGVLLSLKQSGDFNLTENRYLTDLCDNIFEENSDEFHEINNLLLNICSK